ncbi:MAG: copper-translocating P-type ATPase [Chthoniobacterales bacterium]|nr:copper-translocating P-type ATPase [Chthoniobacterales bacterium]
MKTCCHASTISSKVTGELEVDDWRRRFWNALFLSLPLFLLSMGAMLLPRTLQEALIPWTSWIQLLLTLPVIFWVGAPIWKKGLRSFYQRSLNMFSLIVVGVGGTFLYSSWQLFVASSQPSHDLYFEAAAMIMLLVLLGQFLESLGRKKAGTALQELLEAVPTTAMLVFLNQEKEVPVSSLNPGDLVRIHPGEKIPVDGTLVEGSSFIDESLLTGESLPVEKEQGSSVHAGTLNGHGSFVMRVDKVGAATVLGQMKEIVLMAEQHRAPVQKLADRLAAKIVPLIFGVALLTFLGWYLLHPELGSAFALARSLSVLMITCPCVLGLATPLALTVGIRSAARQGVLVRDPVALEQLTAATMIVFDKTGTLTEGKFKVVELKNFSALPTSEWLSILAAAERGSEHPLGAAILRYAEEQGVEKKEASFFQAAPGGGVRAVVEGREVLVGNKKFLAKEKVELSAWEDFFENQKATMVAVAIDHVLIGAVLLSDPIKSDAAEVVHALMEAGLKVGMLTGDHENIACQVAHEIGVPIWNANLSPQEKAEQIQKWQQEKEKVVMIGDGINDAPALSVADVSLAVHRGSNLAKETAGIILMMPSLKSILSARSLSHRTMSVIRQNLFFAFAYNLLAVPLAAGLFYSSLGLLLNPMWATAAMSLSSLSVVGNSLRLRMVANV